RDEKQRQRGSGIAFERLLLQLQSSIELPEGFRQPAIVQKRFGVIRVDVEGTLEAALRAVPVPLAQKQHLSDGDLRVGTLVIERKRSKRDGLCLGKRFAGRYRMSDRLVDQRQREAGMRRRVTRIELRRRPNHSLRLRQLEE